MITKILHDEKNRMYGVRYGYHEGRRFFRVDLGLKSYRFTRKET